MPLMFESFSSRCQIRRLTEEDLPQLLELARSNPVYYEHMHLQPTLENLREDLTALPQNREKTLDDKYFLGYYQKERLLAVLDLIAGYPTEDTAFIGWFMVEKAAQGSGLGTALIEELLDALGAAGFRHVRLGRVKGNPESEGFWRKNRFLPTGAETDAGAYTIVVLQRDL